ncbi:MAG TPA: hypothetical protein IAA21_02310 [Candidatus Blautia faecigallinarum]|uniref:HipA-like C-terminal domain-containing protein n=1 Tax=Candidatus Blautia faecigallinarum TaxID=2838488 RepID=A0A9D2DRG0_9FIRM|nr:hypothetical protein [Candidatus Blautia faecigallinarum]
MEGRTGTEIKNYTIGKEYAFVQKASSKGTQVKYYKDGYWYKIDKCGYESISEFLASLVLKYSNAKDFVDYEICRINGESGCRSRNFLREGEEFLTFQNLYEIYYGGSLSNRIFELREVRERLSFVTGLLYQICKIDVTDYLKKILSLDMLILNEDRHFHNLGVIRSGSAYREAPIFDNGYSLLCDYSRYPGFLGKDELELEIEKAAACPFSGSFEQQALAAGFGLKIDYEGLYAALEQVNDCRGKQILLLQLKRYKRILEF